MTTTLPAQLSIKFNLPIIPVFIERTQKDNFVIEFLNPIKPSDFKNKLEITKKLNEILENMIKKIQVSGYGLTIDGNKVSIFYIQKSFINLFW